MTHEKGNKLKKLIALGIIGVVALAGCSASSEPQATVTVTAEALQPQQTSEPTQREEFITLLQAGEVDDSLFTDKAIDILIDHANDVCSYIREGQTPSDILYLLAAGQMLSESPQMLLDAFAASSVAAVYVYCPEYITFWD